MQKLTIRKSSKAMIALPPIACVILLAGCGQHEETAAPPTQVVKKTVIEKAPEEKPKTVIVQPSPKSPPKTKTETNVTVEVKPAPKKNLPAPAPLPKSGAAEKAPPSTPAVKPATTPQPKTKNSMAPPTKPAVKKFSAAKSASSHGLTVRAEVIATSKAPDPKSAPYKDALIFTKYKVLEVKDGNYNQKEILVAQWAMKNKKLQPAARSKVGDIQTLSLEPLSKRPDLESVMRSDDTEETNLEPYFAE